MLSPRSPHSHEHRPDAERVQHEAQEFLRHVGHRHGKISRRTLLALTALLAGGAVTIEELYRNGFFDRHGDHHEDADHAETHRLLRQDFDAQQETFDHMHAVGMQRYFDTRLHRRRVIWEPREFEPDARVCACCSDEANEHVEDQDGNPMRLVRLPGSGIPLELHGRSPFSDEVITEVAQHMLAKGVTVFTGHNYCGAGKYVLRQWLNSSRADSLAWLQENNIPEADQLAWSTINLFASQFAVRVSGRMRQLLRERDPEAARNIRSLQITEPMMRRPTGRHGRHVARIMYVDESGLLRFDDEPSFNDRGRILPQGLVETSEGEPDESVAKDGELLVKGVLFDDDHAFGQYFGEDPRQQLILCGTGVTPEQVRAAERKVHRIFHRLPESIGRKTRQERLLLR